MLILAVCFSVVIRLLVVKTTIYFKKLELLEKTHECVTSTIEINTVSHNLTTSAYILVLPCVRFREFKLNNRCK